MVQVLGVILCLGFLYWGLRGAYLLYNIIAGFMVATVIGIITFLRHIYYNKD